MHKAHIIWGNRRTELWIFHCSGFLHKTAKSPDAPQFPSPPTGVVTFRFTPVERLRTPKSSTGHEIISLFKYCRLEGDTNFSVGKLQKNNIYIYIYIIIYAINIFIYIYNIYIYNNIYIIYNNIYNKYM